MSTFIGGTDNRQARQQQALGLFTSAHRAFPVKLTPFMRNVWIRGAAGEASVPGYVEHALAGKHPRLILGGVMDRSNGYEAIAPEFLARRGSGRSIGIGVNQVRKWARTFPPGAAVLDLGCGPGFPITEVLVAEGLSTFGVDAAPSFVKAFQRNLPNTPVACEAVQDSRFFDRTFDGVLAWGLLFLLSPDDQRQLIERIAGILVPGGRLLFTSPAEPIVWNDAMTGLESRSPGAAEYRRHLSAVGLSVVSEYEDEGENHYFDACKDALFQPLLSNATPIHSEGA